MKIKRTSAVHGIPSPQPRTALIEAMMRPGFYPHACDGVELSQTLTSWLLFAGQFVYKIKKPVHFPFIDATTPAKRYRLCQEEVQLNGRIASDVYLGVSGIAERPGRSFVLVNDDAPKRRKMTEFAVVMRRLPGHRMLDRMLATGSASASDIQELAKKLAAFHARASIAKSKVWGSAQAICGLVIDNLVKAQDVAADSMTRDSLAVIQRYARQYVIAHQQTLDNRVRDGRIREGHGDLRCRSVCFSGPQLTILGCVEYAEGLRYADVASEVASLAVDLELLGRADLSDEFLKAYIADTNDPQVWDLLSFYKCYRAVLRGKLETLASLQSELPASQRMAARGNARQLFALAHSYSEGRSGAFVGHAH